MRDTTLSAIELQLLQGDEFTLHAKTIDRAEIKRDKDGRDTNDSLLSQSLPQWMGFRDRAELAFFVLVLLHLVPVVLLAVYAPKLSKQLANNGCLPNGDFAVPGTTSVWNSDYFFTVTIALGMDRGWSYTHVKVIDIVWDVVVGRGGQAILIYIAYRVFNRSLAHVMATRPVSYKTYGAVAFGTGNVQSMWQFVLALTRCAFRPDKQGYRVFTAMLLTTAYIGLMPTLFAAMTGYAAIATPSVELLPQGVNGSCADYGRCYVTPCGNTLHPGWGIALDAIRANGGSTAPSLIAMDNPDDPLRKYYDIYKADYNAAADDTRCQNVTTLTACPPLAKTSEFKYGSETKSLDSPLLNIQKWDVNNTTHIPNVWLCSGLILNTADFDSRNVTGFCTADSNYQWGFSFSILFMVCVLQFLFAIITYALWIEAHRYCAIGKRRNASNTNMRDPLWEAAARPTLLSSAVAIASHASHDFGTEIIGWTSLKLDRVVWQGRRGMQMGQPNIHSK